jgi:SAM-dependent methyltransferase
VEFEQLKPQVPFDGVVACVSLHHVASLDAASSRIHDLLRPGGTLVVVEWAWEKFDEATALWCFSRLPALDGSHGDEVDEEDLVWLQKHRLRWTASGQPWERYLREWAGEHGLHAGHAVISALEKRFSRTSLHHMPYFFSELENTPEAAEQAAIDAGDIQATGIRYVGRNS